MPCGCRKARLPRTGTTQVQVQEEEQMAIVGQRAPRRREGGVWVEVTDENGSAPQASEVVEADEYEDEAAAEEEATVEEAEEAVEEEPVAEEEEEDEGAELNKMSRAELDAYAREQGLDPSQYRNRELLLEALDV